MYFVSLHRHVRSLSRLDFPMLTYRIAQLCAAIVFLPCLAVAAWSQIGHDTAISGHVLHKGGSPVAGAEVEWHSFNPVDGVVPGPVHTDKKGAYRIDNPMVGRGVLSASKVSSVLNPHVDRTRGCICVLL
jgi:hypothetical protein